MEKLLPQNTEAECGVLASIIIDPDAVAQVADFLCAADFYRDAHKTIFETILHLYEGHQPADFITVCDELERRGKLSQVGGASYITSLINQVPTSGNVEFYGRIVERTVILRRLIHAAGEQAADAFEGDPQALEKAEARLYAIAKRRAPDDADSLETLLLAYMNDLDHLHQHRDSLLGVPTGYTDLDRILGGLQRSDLVILAARPSTGKTAFALGLALQAAKAGFAIGFFSLEMSKKQLVARLMSMQSGIDSQYLRSGRIADYEWDRIVEAQDRLAGLPLWIDDTAGLSTMALRSKARRMQTEHKIDLLVVDYLQLMQARNESNKRYDNEVQETTEISRALKGLAKELQVPVLALSQLSRAVETRADKRPQLWDLRQSGSIEQDADVVLFLYRDEMYHPDKPVDSQGHAVDSGHTEVHVAKHRNGPTGEIELHFEASQTRFCDD